VRLFLGLIYDSFRKNIKIQETSGEQVRGD